MTIDILKIARECGVATGNPKDSDSANWNLAHDSDLIKFGQELLRLGRENGLDEAEIECEKFKGTSIHPILQLGACSCASMIRALKVTE